MRVVKMVCFIMLCCFFSGCGMTAEDLAAFNAALHDFNENTASSQRSYQHMYNNSFEPKYYDFQVGGSPSWTPIGM